MRELFLGPWTLPLGPHSRDGGVPSGVGLWPDVSPQRYPSHCRFAPRQQGECFGALSSVVQRGWGAGPAHEREGDKETGPLVQVLQGRHPLLALPQAGKALEPSLKQNKQCLRYKKTGPSSTSSHNVINKGFWGTEGPLCVGKAGVPGQLLPDSPS